MQADSFHLQTTHARIPSRFLPDANSKWQECDVVTIFHFRTRQKSLGSELLWLRVDIFIVVHPNNVAPYP